MSEINDFWALDQSIMEKDMIINKCVEYYTEDFINNYSKWKENVSIINETIKKNLIGKLSPENYVDMTFDFFCKGIIDMFKNHINTYGTLLNEDIFPLSNELINQHCQTLIKESPQAKPNIVDLLNGVKKFIIK